jgi:hypothetical protein
VEKEDYNNVISSGECAEAIRNFKVEAELIPKDKQATLGLFNVLLECQSENQPKNSWPKALVDVISCGEQAVNPLSELIKDAQDEQDAGRILYFAIALCYTRSPKIAEPLCSLLEKNLFISGFWPHTNTIFDAFAFLYIATARAFYWSNATSILPRLRSILNRSIKCENALMMALPYALRAVGFIGNNEDIPLVKNFISFSCPYDSCVEAAVRREAGHALYALRHPNQRDIRANSRSDTWKR